MSKTRLSTWAWGLRVFALLLGACAVAKSSAGAEPRTLAERLGYKPADRLLIIHADDAGMCHSVNVATIRALEKGIVTCASVMVPCPWFPEMAKYAREHPEADLGVHLTLTSEWGLYRWRPVAPQGEVRCLLDKEGFLPHGVIEVLGQATAPEVETEIRCQIARARQFGMVPTHVDSHMGTLFTGKFYRTYTGAAKDLGVMPMLVAPNTPELRARAYLVGVDPVKSTADLRAQGFLFLDALNTGEKGDTLEARRARYYDFFRNLKPGVTQVIVHLSLDDEEIRSIAGSWERRWHEYQIFTDPKTRELIDQLGIKLIGYRDLQKLFGKGRE